VEAVLQSMPEHFPIKINNWIVMPNHVQILLTITGKSKDNSPFDSNPPVKLSVFGGLQTQSPARLFRITNLFQRAGFMQSITIFIELSGSGIILSTSSGTRMI
jgi:hypothetical protein